ncbi:MAG TPA: DUF1565 domain-containing protein, partial [Anaerolineaceae bacterium]|nr:DUF1565 domain-containing protein [Anaerolineaceae bacterium]
MKKYKFYQMIFILISMLLIPTSSALAQTSTVYLPLISRSEETTKSILPQIQIPLPQTPSPNYYVSLSGNDANSGTLAKPWRTIKKATDTLVAGDTVKILPGTYKEKLIPKNSGTSNAYIIYTADPGTVILDGSGVDMP